MIWLLACAPKVDPGVPRVVAAAEPVRLLARPVADAPDVYFAALVAAGSAYDPIGAEGLAHLVARSLVDAGAGQRSSEEVRAVLYPTGNTFEVVVDREWASVRLRCHRDQAALCAELFADALTAPRFDGADVDRLRDEAVHTVTDGLRADEEALAAEVLEASVYEGHPYGHPVEGRAGVLPLLEVADLAAFHRAHYVREAMLVGLAGGFDDALKDDLARRLELVPGLPGPDLTLLGPAPITGRSLVVVDTDTPVTGFRLASPTSLGRGSEDWPAMLVAITALGAHRQSFGRLFGALRGDRGLNYGDYAYLEPYVERGRSSAPEQGVLRRTNQFRVWIRPTSLENGPFALKLAVDEVERWVTEGLEPEEFEDIRGYLRSSLPLLAPDPGRRLLYALDAAATGTPDPFERLPAALDALTVEQVNAAIPKYVDPANLRIVAVTGEPDLLVKALTGAAPTPITYAEGAANPELAERDTQVAAESLGIEPRAVVVVPVEGLFR